MHAIEERRDIIRRITEARIVQLLPFRENLSKEAEE
jgi:hypothetical protein